MKKHLIVLFLSFICLTAVAQKVTLGIHQSEPLQITAPSTEFRVLSGNQIVLGNDLVISGGSGHYEQIWSGTGWTVDSIKNTVTVAPLVATVYSFMVIDEKGCSAQQLFHVDVIYPIQLECNTSPVSCYGQNNGIAKLKITGGAPPYNIAWSNGETTDVVNNLMPGAYPVTVTDNMNQTQEKTIIITEPQKIITTLDIAICQGSSYKFAGIDRTTAGQYKNNMKTKNGCDSAIILNLTVNPFYTKTLEAQICQGSAYVFAGIDRTTTGQYQNNLRTKSGCDSTVILNLSVNSLPDIPVITQDGDILRSSSLIGNQWLKDGAVLPGEIRQTLVITRSGNYKVTVTNNSGCSKESTIYNAIKTDVPIIQNADFACKVFPNPNSGMFTIELESDQSDVLDLELFTSDGKSIIKQSIEHLSGKQKIPFGKANLVEGVYTLRITLGTQFLNRKLIVNQ